MYVEPWASTRFFPGVLKLGDLVDERPKRGTGAGAPVLVWGETHRSWRHVLKIMHKYFVYWDFRQYLLVTNAQKHFKFLGGGYAPFLLPMSEGAMHYERKTIRASLLKFLTCFSDWSLKVRNESLFGWWLKKRASATSFQLTWREKSFAFFYTLP